VSRLDSVIRRLEAQRACLNRAAELVADLPGPALELGLGNGRTYDHMRSLLGDRPIYVFEREIAAHPDCIPPDDRLYLGDARETLKRAAARLEPAALAHADIGTGDEALNRALAAEIAPLLDALMRPGGVIMCDQPMRRPRWTPLPLPDGIEPGRYNLFRVGET